MRASERAWIGKVGLVALAFVVARPQDAWSADESAPAPSPAAKTTGPATARAKKSAPAVKVNVSALTEKLKSSDPEAIDAALVEAKSAGNGARPLAPAIEEVLRRGAGSDIVVHALSILGEIGSDASVSLIASYCRHRSPEIRRQALTALGHRGGAAAVAALQRALSDADPGVRGVAASGLGPARGHAAVSDLFLALDHQVLEAASSIGQLCTPGECEKLAAKLGIFGLDVMASAFDSILFRPASEVPDDAKVRIVARVRDLRTEEANKFLRDVQSRWGPADSPRVRQAIEQAVQATGAFGAASVKEGGTKS